MINLFFLVKGCLMFNFKKTFFYIATLVFANGIVLASESSLSEQDDLIAKREIAPIAAKGREAPYLWIGDI